MQNTINVVEPTLMTEAGHCYSFISAFCKASDESHTICLWVNRYAKLGFTGTNIRIRKYFFRKIRRAQCYFLYRRLLASPDKLFISTASTSDLMLLNWASRGAIQQDKVFLYFHWLNISEKKFAHLKKLAEQLPNIVIFGPTLSVTKVFKETGFNNVSLVPYPIAAQIPKRNSEHQNFKGLLYAGAARQDKGISHIVDFLEYMKKLALQMPFYLQNSPNHHGEYDAATKADMQRLGEIDYPYLKCISETLNAEEYGHLFIGMICIQLYNQALFADRVSGVTLDALSAGSPIVTTEGTWIARMVQRFDAGIVINRTEPDQVLSAIQKIMANYAHYNKKAYAAGLTLRQENNAGILFKALAG